MKKSFITIILFFTFFSCFAETTEYDTIIKKRVVQIIDNPEYRVTPGDSFVLKFSLSNISEPVTLNLLVDGNYEINLSYLGTVNAKNLTYSQVQEKIKSIITREHPKSFPAVVIQSPGEFNVCVDGEIIEVQNINAWGFTRLSDILYKVQNQYTSLRNIKVTHEDRSVEFFDLYKYIYLNDETQNPYVRRNDIITVSKIFGKFNITGELYRDGSFEIVSGETFEDIKKYIGDFKPAADLNSIEITRYLPEQNYQGKTSYININTLNDIALKDLDKIRIFSGLEQTSRVFFQGAIGSESDNESSKITIELAVGDKLSYVAKKLKGKFLVSSDLENAILIRKNSNEKYNINLDSLIYKENPIGDIELEDGDLIIIPFRQYKVYVAGQVTNPGEYPFIPNRTWEYYIGLAGGFNLRNHMGDKVKIRDVYGDKFDQDERIIQPEDMIYAPTNHPMYYVREYGSDIAIITSTIIACATLCYTVDQLVKGNPDNVLSNN